LRNWHHGFPRCYTMTSWCFRSVWNYICDYRRHPCAVFAEVVVEWFDVVGNNSKKNNDILKVLKSNRAHVIKTWHNRIYILDCETLYWNCTNYWIIRNRSYTHSSLAADLRVTRIEERAMQAPARVCSSSHLFLVASSPCERYSCSNHMEYMVNSPFLIGNLLIFIRYTLLDSS